MATLAEFLFEGAAGDGWSAVVGGGGAIDTVDFAEGVQSIYFDCTGSAKTNDFSLPAGTRQLAVRFYYRIKTDAAATATIVQGNAAGMRLQARNGRKLRVQINATSGVDSAALNLNQWYLIDLRFNSSAATATADYSINGAAQGGTSVAQAATDMTSFRLGNTGTVTLQEYFDALKLTNVAADYPLGGITRNAAATQATGTGAASGATDKVSPTGGNAASTGAAAAATTKVSPVVPAATGTGVVGNPTASIKATATAAAGAGAAPNATVTQVSNVSAVGGAATATGAASDATVLQVSNVAAIAGLAPGTGTANPAGVSTTDEAPGDTALGTGAAGDGSTVVAPVLALAAGTGAALDASVVASGAQAADAQTATATGAAFDATVSASTVPVAPTGTSTAGRYRRRRPTDEFGYPTDMVWKEPPPLDRKPVLVMADIARGHGGAFDATTVWDDDESALLLLFGIAA